MFAEIVSGLKEGKLPEVTVLRGRCHAAVTKKLAFVQLPPVYWETDPKRNPDTMHLLWGVWLLHDADMLEVVKGIILMEQAEKEGLSLEEFMQHSMSELLALTPDISFREVLKQQVTE
jgi:hypothetical protein